MRYLIFVLCVNKMLVPLSVSTAKASDMAIGAMTDDVVTIVVLKFA
jgi:hypothetical protein